MKPDEDIVKTVLDLGGSQSLNCFDVVAAGALRANFVLVKVGCTRKEERR